MKTQSKAQHTPGPWEVRHIEEGPAKRRGFIIRKFGTSHTIVEQRYPFDYDVALANARLIAAAPRMAEAGRELLAILSAQFPSIGMGGNGLGAAMAEMNAALKEAGIVAKEAKFCNCGHALHMSDNCKHRDEDDGVPCDCCLSFGSYPEER